MSGFLIPAASKTSTIPSDTTALSTICLIAVSISASDYPVPVGSNFVNRAFTA
jgi:hypothetical protein